LNGALFDSGKLVTDVGTVLPLEEARVAHEMLGGAPHKRGKIVLSVAADFLVLGVGVRPSLTVEEALTDDV
jgi:hypothetical protein